MKPPGEAIAALLEGRHDDPFSLLGVFAGPDGVFARAWVPGAETLEARSLDGVSLGVLVRIDDRGLFEGAVEDAPQPIRYAASGGGADWSYADPYTFGPVLGPTDDYLMNEGSHHRLYDKLGAHLIEHEGAAGVHFAVWAPNAQRVSVVGDFNDWDARRHVMRRRNDVGVWEIFVPDIGAGRTYKFAIVGPDGQARPLKADPFAFAAELRPATGSVTRGPLTHSWQDQGHRDHWASVDPRRQPMSIYEVHAGSWDRDDNGWYLSWDALADRLIPYVVDLGFTHIEFLPVSEYPYDPSWGYQTTGLYAPSSRFGDVEGFARFVDGAHQAGIGVLLDWVPAHFPTDDHGLSLFDGTALYEHADPKLGFHPDWNTAIYNFGRREVASYLVNNALFWTERYHVDGLRVDAVASMLYRDYSRKAGEWIPNEQGGRENWEAVAFLRDMNRAVYGARPGAFTVAEESTSWPGVSKPAHEDGLGFGFKWNMGFMHDTLQYMQRDPIHRPHHHDEITFGLVYAFSENFVLPLSHDEVVHGKGSLLTKMAGDDAQKFASLRAYYGLMWGYPGKKLLFMGQEFAQRREWSEDRALDWGLRGAPAHEGVRNAVRELNRLHRTEPALHARDCEGEGFEWLIADDRANSVFAWLRKAPGAAPIAVISNMTPVERSNYRVPLPGNGRWTEIFNSDALDYGGDGLGNLGSVLAAEGRATLTLPPLSTIMLRHEG
ncbi:glycogen branching protein [Brevundimonas sp. Leaf363]|uniref:1,4-alpha-glucan branching protein GlgB n=1 Tax=Brevundimonas sp. Leaf363 TaxID=1736353 RepID=UPI0007012925|nr:1,4-alpha-glucan branching protein GlgB [Brevundimonas sp. Leaf363]KQS54442.1 glycogen branching protein [Brevundimonas sp. Leaf363]